jgi:1-acyl-sn-glycerol-3-phosphate acyltransferase
MFDPANFHTVAVKLAHRAGVPIVPLAMVTDAWALGKRFADFGRIDPSKKVRFAFGEPMTVSGRGADEQQALIDFIRGNLAAWDAADGLKRLAPIGVTAAG